MVTSLNDSPAKPLPPFVRQRLTLQSALLTNPQRYIKNVRFDIDNPEVIPERELPLKPVVNEKTQTRDVMDAETSTKTTRLSSLESKTSTFKTKCVTLAKEAMIVSRSPYSEIARLIRRDGSVARKTAPTLAGAADSKTVLPEIKRRRGILKKVLEEVNIDGMRSQGTVTERKQPTLERILKENHLYLKYSKSCRRKKKRVRMEKEPEFSYFSKRPEESMHSLEASGDERPKTVMEDDEDSSNSSEESLERKPARLVLRTPSGEPDAAPDRWPSVLHGRPSVLVCNMASAPQLNKIALEKQAHPLRSRQVLTVA